MDILRKIGNVLLKILGFIINLIIDIIKDSFSSEKRKEFIKQQEKHLDSQTKNLEQMNQSGEMSDSQYLDHMDKVLDAQEKIENMKEYNK